MRIGRGGGLQTWASGQHAAGACREGGKQRIRMHTVHQRRGVTWHRLK